MTGEIPEFDSLGDLPPMVVCPTCPRPAGPSAPFAGEIIKRVCDDCKKLPGGDLTANDTN